jgi:hypothetical protein
MELKIEVKINPPQETEVTADQLDALTNGHLHDFEKWFMQRQRNQGIANPSPLIGVEGGILKTYVMYLATEKP